MKNNANSPFVKVPAKTSTSLTLEFIKEAAALDEATLDSIFLRYARRYPSDYLRTIGHISVMTELVAMLTPSVALGLQWVTALCKGPSLVALIELLTELITCLLMGSCRFHQDSEQSKHCILDTRAVTPPFCSNSDAFY